MIDKLQEVEKRYLELEEMLGQPDVLANTQQYQKLAKEFSDISPVMETARLYRDVQKQLKELKELLGQKHDQEFEQMARSELKDLEAKEISLKEKLQLLLFPPKEEQDRNIIMEIRAGTGGQEASLFAADLYRMYTKYAENKGWKTEAISSNTSETGGLKEVIFSISGKGASRFLKWESGTHRVQRVPTTEASGRIHTSAATVAVLFEPEEVEVAIDPKDLKIDVFRSSGPGGQSVNTTDSAIRITHLPTGLVVASQTQRSQAQNRERAMQILLSKLYQLEEAKKAEEVRKAKGVKKAIEWGSQIRSYVLHPYTMVKDLRTGEETSRASDVLDGELEQFIEAEIRLND